MNIINRMVTGLGLAAATVSGTACVTEGSNAVSATGHQVGLMRQEQVKAGTLAPLSSTVKSLHHVIHETTPVELSPPPVNLAAAPEEGTSFR